ncbi:MAG: sterol desaturase family protein [Pseudomonadota bacterium]|nr:sterol desaturase family protein [Pseudomonadota bacterium]
MTVENLLSTFEGLILPVIIFLLLAILAKKKTFELLPIKSTVENVALIIINGIVLIPFLFIYSNLFEFEALFLNSNSVWQSYPPIICFLFVLLIGDFIGYWRHRFEHTRFLWPSHLIHHSDQKMIWLTLQRFHPLNRISTVFIDGGLLYFLGFPLEAVIFNSTVRHYYGYFIHADLQWHYGKLNKVFVSPLLHQAHHAQPREYHHSNFATLFSFYDVLFNTYKMPSSKNFELGVAYAKKMSLMEQLVYPFKKSSYFKFKTKQ